MADGLEKGEAWAGETGSEAPVGPAQRPELGLPGGRALIWKWWVFFSEGGRKGQAWRPVSSRG